MPRARGSKTVMGGVVSKLSWTALIGTLGAFAVMLWGVYTTLTPEKKTLTIERREAMREATADLLVSFPRVGERIVRLTVAPLAGDFTGEVTQHLRDALDSEGFFNVASPLLTERARDQLRLEKDEAGNFEQALKIARRSDSEWVLWGQVRRLAQRGEEVSVDIELVLNEVDSRDPRWHKRVTYESPGFSNAGRPVPLDPAEGAGFGLLHRLALCLLFCALLPLAAIPVSRQVFERESNLATFLLLASFAAVNVLGFLLLLRGALPTFVYVAVVCLLAVVAVWYDYWVCEKVERNR